MPVHFLVLQWPVMVALIVWATPSTCPFTWQMRLQGFSVWTKETPGLASNWHIVMPNPHGVSDDGKKFNGVASAYCSL
jgi:hypothetical protein